jgi:hypothetical protein
LTCNRIWYFDTGSSTWGAAEKTVGFKERMGHACVILSEKEIWVLGGQGESACLNDVWKLGFDDKGDLSSSECIKENNRDGWDPRCMFNAIKSGNSVWVAGGVDAPNGTPLGDMWWGARNSKPLIWTKRKPGVLQPDLEGAIGMGGTLLGTYPRLIITRQKRGAGDRGTKTHLWLATRLTEELTDWTGPTDGPELHDPSKKDNPIEWFSSPHSITAVCFDKRLYVRFLHRDAMRAGAGDPLSPLYVYV